MREREIEAYLVKRVKALGGEVRKVQWIGRRGAPDRLVMLPYETTPPLLMPSAYSRLADLQGASRFESLLSPAGVSFWVELKAPGKKPSVLQLGEHVRMSQLGERVFVIDSVEAIDVLFDPGKPKPRRKLT